MALRLIFMGTPDFSVSVLEKLIDQGHEIVAVYSQPPRKSGRGMKLSPSPVQACAEKHHIKVFTPTSLKTEQEREIFAAHKADAAVVVAYGLILPQAILDLPKHGCFNVHASLLPRWRGAAPIQRAIMAGDDETGVTIMQMEAGLDTGPMCLKQSIAITNQTTASSLHDELATIGAELMAKALNDLKAGKLGFTQQPEEGVTYAAKIDKPEARINFAQSANKVLRHIHGLSPFPGAWLNLQIDDQEVRIKILQAETSMKSGNAGCILDDQFTIACQQGSIAPIRLQRQGKGAMDLETFLRGTKVSPNMCV